jgi:hypothetical protein
MVTAAPGIAVVVTLLARARARRPEGSRVVKMMKNITGCRRTSGAPRSILRSPDRRPDSGSWAGLNQSTRFPPPDATARSRPKGRQGKQLGGPVKRGTALPMSIGPPGETARRYLWSGLTCRSKSRSRGRGRNRRHRPDSRSSNAHAEWCGRSSSLAPSDRSSVDRSPIDELSRDAMYADSLHLVAPTRSTPSPKDSR